MTTWTTPGGSLQQVYRVCSEAPLALKPACIHCSYLHFRFGGRRLHRRGVLCGGGGSLNIATHTPPHTTPKLMAVSAPPPSDLQRCINKAGLRRGVSSKGAGWHFVHSRDAACRVAHLGWPARMPSTASPRFHSTNQRPQPPSHLRRLQRWARPRRTRRLRGALKGHGPFPPCGPVCLTRGWCCQRRALQAPLGVGTAACPQWCGCNPPPHTHTHTHTTHATREPFSAAMETQLRIFGVIQTLNVAHTHEEHKAGAASPSQRR
jgi:hypothetical protein